MEFFDLLRTLLQWVAGVLVGVVGYLYRVLHLQNATLKEHNTEIAVIKAVQQANKEAHDREFKEMRSNFAAVLTKLDSIEQYLRK